MRTGHRAASLKTRLRLYHDLPPSLSRGSGCGAGGWAFHLFIYIRMVSFFNSEGAHTNRSCHWSWVQKEVKEMQMEKNTGKRFEGKVAIVTASTQGIGFAIAQRLGFEGASLVISSRKQKNVDEAVEKLRGKGIEVLGVVCHVSNSQHRKNLIEKTLRKYGRIDVIVSNAAANPSVDSILETKESVLDKLWDINVKASILLLQDAVAHLQKGSSVVLISSITAFSPPAGMSMYGVTKTALLGLTKALAAEMAPNTRVNCVAPGFVPTHFAEFLTKSDEMRNSLEEKTLLNRLGKTEDMAAATAFLASDDAAYITGETLVVAGGIYHRSLPWRWRKLLVQPLCPNIVGTPSRIRPQFRAEVLVDRSPLFSQHHRANVLAVTGTPAHKAYFQTI